MAERTIAAISTALGSGGISVIRISGENAIDVADKCFKTFSGEKLQSLSGYRAAYGEVVDENTVLDDAVATVFKAPKSYTGEDVVEISVHGGRFVAREVLRTVLKCGAFPADGGEFTKRAFLNGKLDLTKAESIMGIISAENQTALRISRAAREGRVSREIDTIVEKLLETAASLAAYADYPDEELPELSPERFSALLSEVREKTGSLLKTYDAGKVIREGIECAIVGKPNVGKSTLMNMLSGTERSIVTDIAGTTRDVIEETVRVGDIVLHLADTAGIHETDDAVESVGVQRALQRIEIAGLVLAVFDGSSELDRDDMELLENLKDKSAIIILNKSDLPQQIDKTVFAGLPVVETSAKSGEGNEKLTEIIAELTNTASLDPDSAVLINERQRDCAKRAFDAVTEADNALLCGCTLDAVGVCVDDALTALLELTGKRVTEEVTNEVFRRFCVGK